MTTETQIRRQGEAKPERMRDRCVYTPPVDIVEAKDGLTLLADMPGVKSEDLSIEYENGVLTLHGKVESRERENAKCLVREYGTGDYVRTFAIGEGIDVNKIQAEFRDGVLKLHLPKAEALKPRKIEVHAG